MNNEKQIKRINACLYLAAAIQALSVAWYALKTMELLKEYPEVNSDIALKGFGTSGIYLAIFLVATYFVVKGLKSQQGWAWLGAVTVLIFSSASFALPICIYGLVMLFRVEVRAEFLTKLDLL